MVRRMRTPTRLHWLHFSHVTCYSNLVAWVCVWRCFVIETHKILNRLKNKYNWISFNEAWWLLSFMRNREMREKSRPETKWHETTEGNILKKQHKTCKYLVCVFHGQFVHTTHTKIVNFIMCRDKCYKIWYILSIEHLFIGKIIIHKKVVPWMMSKIDDYWRRRRL